MESLAAATLNPTLIPALFAGRDRNSALDLWVNAKDAFFQINMRVGLLYRLTFQNGKAYIGITCETLKQRVRRHILYARQGRMFALSCAIRKYGEDSFLAEVLGTAESSELKQMEIETIREHRQRGIVLYNMTDGGDGSLGVSPSQQTRAKISASLSGRKLSDQHRIQIGESQKGKRIPDEVRIKMRESAKARCAVSMSDEQRQKKARRIGRAKTITRTDCKKSCCPQGKRKLLSRRSAPATHFKCVKAFSRHYAYSSAVDYGRA